MRISDWSSDVCSSDLDADRARANRRSLAKLLQGDEHGRALFGVGRSERAILSSPGGFLEGSVSMARQVVSAADLSGAERPERSEARRGGQEVVSTCRSQWASYH